MSRFVVSEAKRSNVRLKVAFDGPSGSGKTLSSLLVAFGVTKDWNKIIVADTEKDSALYYVGQEIEVLNSKGAKSTCKIGNFKHIPFNPPYSPSDYIELIQHVEKLTGGVGVLILDGITPEWDGEGGCLDLQNKLGGKFSDWAKVSPLHTAFIEAIVKSPLHIFCTMRTKQEYAVEANEKGKTEVKKLGTKAVQRDSVEYEFSIVFDIQHCNHYAAVGKDRTNLFANSIPFQLTPAIGDKLIKWANGQDTEVTE